MKEKGKGAGRGRERERVQKRTSMLSLWKGRQAYTVGIMQGNCLLRAGGLLMLRRQACKRQREAWGGRLACRLKMGVACVSAWANSPEWMASMMARVNLSFMRLPSP